MKLAREIAEELFPISENMRQYNSDGTYRRELQRKVATPIIAVKLEPVRGALEKAECGGYEGDCPVCGNWPPKHHSDCELKAALALLSEEE